MQREFIVAEQEDEYGEIILSLAAIEVRAATLLVLSCSDCDPVLMFLPPCDAGGCTQDCSQDCSMITAT